VSSLMPPLLYPRRKRPRYPLDRRLGGPQDRSGRSGEEKFFSPSGNLIPADQPVAHWSKSLKLSLKIINILARTE
jgi:hypothetical protein